MGYPHEKNRLRPQDPPQPQGVVALPSGAGNSGPFVSFGDEYKQSQDAAWSPEDTKWLRDKATEKQDQCPRHEWKTYMGFVEFYEYCEHCDLKRWPIKDRRD